MSQQPYVPNTGLNAFIVNIQPTVHPVAPLSGHGSPEGVVPANPGTLWTDIDTNEVYLKIVGVQLMGWQKVGVATAAAGGGIQRVFSGSATDPNGTISADAPAYYYSTVDSSQWYKTGSGSAGWLVFVQ